jgi:hypothetical protein
MCMRLPFQSVATPIIYMYAVCDNYPLEGKLSVMREMRGSDFRVVFITGNAECLLSVSDLSFLCAHFSVALVKSAT